MGCCGVSTRDSTVAVEEAAPKSTFLVSENVSAGIKADMSTGSSRAATWLLTVMSGVDAGRSRAAASRSCPVMQVSLSLNMKARESEATACITVS